MSKEMDGLTGPYGLFQYAGSLGEWQVWRNNDGEIELYRTDRIDETGAMHGLERKVTKAKTVDELDAYFTPRPSAKDRRDPDQIDLIKQAEELNRSHEQS